jgi:superoxide dismutase
MKHDFKPIMSAETLQYYDDKHHASYLSKLNRLIIKNTIMYPDFAKIVKDKGFESNNKMKSGFVKVCDHPQNIN